MSTFLELLVSGVSLGFVYALVALGFVIVYRAAGVVNFAHGSLLVLSGLVTALLSQHVSFWIALAGGIAAACVMGLLVQVILSVAPSSVDVGALSIATIGIDIVLVAEFTRQLGSDRLVTDGTPWGTTVLEFFGVHVPASRLWAAACAVVVLVALFVALRRTGWGAAMRAVAEDPEAAALMGLKLSRVKASAWIVAGVLATLAVLFLTAYPTTGLSSHTGTVALAAFMAAIIGGLDSPGGAVAGGLIVGVAQSLVIGYQEQLPFLGDGFGSLMPYVVMVAVVLVRPAGLFGSKELTRV